MIPLDKFIKRFLIPAPLVTALYYLKYRCFLSMRAEIEYTPNLVIGPGTNVGSFTKIKASEGPLVIGRDVQIAMGCWINSGKAGVTIGDDCMIATHTAIIGNNYRWSRLDTPIRLQECTSKGISIENNVWIGVGACILDGAQIGEGAIITPHSVVAARIPQNSIVQGNPGKIIFTRR
jgi:acetyltransferase-like isoleucine patch superfamily enzyme